MATPTPTTFVSATTTALKTPAYDDKVQIPGWKQWPLTPELEMLQRILDEGGVDIEWVDMCAEALPCYASTDSDIADATGFSWPRMYKFGLASGAGIGIAVSKKVAPCASERHCALLFVEKLGEPGSIELKMFFRRFGGLIQD